YEQPVLREDHDHLYWALDFLDKGHVKAAAVHVRTKFELVLKWASYELGLSVKYHPDPRKVPASDFWAAVSGATFDKIPSVESARNSKGRLCWWQPPPAKTPVVSAALKNRITHAVSWVLNPLNHSQSVDRYKPEIEDAVFAVDELERAVRDALLF